MQKNYKIIKKTFGEVYQQWVRIKSKSVSFNLRENYKFFNEHFFTPFADIRITNFHASHFKKIISSVYELTSAEELDKYNQANKIPLKAMVKVTLMEIIDYCISRHYIKSARGLAIIKDLK